MRELLRARPRRRDGVRFRLRSALRPGAEPFALEPRELLSTDVLTYHNDNARTGRNLNETVLTPSTVNPATFGKLFSYPVDGDVYAQPLYETGVRIRGALHNVVFVATTHDSVYAFDADSNLGPNAAPLWKTSFINPAFGITTVPGSDLDTANFSEVGIIGTPVIDKATGTLYVSAMTKEATASGPVIVHRLHALDVSTGFEKFGGPKFIQATVPGTAGDGTGQTVSFNAAKQLQRSALLLSNGIVYVAFASFQNYPYHGWLLAYNASNLQQVAAFNVTPDTRQGSIWMSGGGPAADAAGNVFVATANGKFTAAAGGRDYGDSVLRLNGNTLKVVDYYSPSNQQSLDSKDQDLGSGGVVLLPSQAGGSVPLIVAADKNGTIYLLNRDHLGRFHPGGNDVVGKSSPGIIGTLNGDTNLWLGAYDTPAYFNNALYYAAPGDRLKMFPVANGHLVPFPTRVSTNTFAYPGGTPSISAYGSTNGIVWVLENGKGGAVLHAYDAANITREIYNSNMAAGFRDKLGKGVKFAVPTVADGKVFAASSGQLTVFGDFNNGYVAGERSLLAQGFSVPQVYLMLSASPASATVWHPATAQLTNLLDRQAQGNLLLPQPQQIRRVPRPPRFGRRGRFG